MERFIQHDSLHIRHFTTLKWPFPLHNHNYFELVFVHYGRGLHCLNEIPVPYEGPSLFLLAPADYHIFKIEKETEFSVLKFNNVYLGGPGAANGIDDWSILIDHLLTITSTVPSGLVRSAEELQKIGQLMHLIVNEWETNSNSGNETLLYLIRAVFSLIKRNAVYNRTSGSPAHESLSISVLNYIHTHIQDPEKLQLRHLAQAFSISAIHLSNQFRREIGSPIKGYIDTYKLQLIENRLKYGKLTLKEISNEFGFTDLSHFNKFIKKHNGISPKDYRKEIKNG